MDTSPDNQHSDSISAEIAKTRAQEAKFRAEAEEIRTRTKWWWGPSLIRYLVAGVILGALGVGWFVQVYLPLKNQQGEFVEKQSELRKVELKLIEAKLQVQRDSLERENRYLLQQTKALENRYGQLVHAYSELQKEKDINLKTIASLKKAAESEISQLRKQIRTLESRTFQDTLNQDTLLDMEGRPFTLDKSRLK